MISGIKSKKIVGFDMDGVIIDHSALKIKLAEERGFKLAPEQTHSEMIKKIIPPQSLEEIKYMLYDHPETSLLPVLMEGAEKGLEKIKKSGIRYFLISKRKNTAAAVKFLRTRGLWPKHFSETNAFFVSEAEDKNKKAAELGVSHYVDDQTEVLEKLVDVKNRILFDRFEIFGKTGFLRVKSWKDLMERVL